MKKESSLKKTIWTIIGILVVIIIYIFLLLFFPILWIRHRLLPYKKRIINIELMVRAIDIPRGLRGFFEGWLGNNQIHRAIENEIKLPPVFYIPKKDYSKFAEHIARSSDKTVLINLEISYWKYGFGKSKFISYKLLDKKPKVRK